MRLPPATRLKESSPLIGQACAIGNGRPYNVALIVVDPDVAARYDSDDTLRTEVQAGVDAANARLARVEQIKRFASSPTSGCPTPPS